MFAAEDPASVVANVDLLCKRLGWRRRYDDLNTMIGHALAWEKNSAQR